MAFTISRLSYHQKKKMTKPEKPDNLGKYTKLVEVVQTICFIGAIGLPIVGCAIAWGWPGGLVSGGIMSGIGFLLTAYLLGQIVKDE